MRNIRVHFEDGNTLVTGINGNNAEIEAYYIGKTFNFGDNEEHPADKMVKAVRVEFLDQKKYRASFVGREVGAIGIFYPITATVEGEDEKAAELNLYQKYDHISRLSLVELPTVSA